MILSKKSKGIGGKHTSKLEWLKHQVLGLKQSSELLGSLESIINMC